MSGKIQDIFSHHWKTALVALILVGLAASLFWPTLGYGYVKLDDDQYICLNPHVLTGLCFENIRWAFTTVYELTWWPFLWISYMVDTELFGTEPFGYHLTNILLHVANTTLLFWVLFRLTGSRWRSFFVAALFTVHPLRVEAVAWITARKDVLSGLFFMLSLLAHIRYVEQPTRGRRDVLFLLMLAGLLSKAILIVLPFILLLLDYWPLGRAGDPLEKGAWTRWRPLLIEKAGLFGLAVIFIGINLYTHRPNLTGENALPSITRVGLVFPNYWAYLGKTFWPGRLSVIYPENDVANWLLSIIAAAGLLGLSTGLIWFRRKAPYGIVGWLWFLIALFPVIRGLRLGFAAYADRFTYLPSIGLGIASVWSVAALVERRSRLRIPAVSIGIVLLCACMVRSSVRLPAWKNSMTMFSELIEFAPDHFVANNAYGFALLESGRVEESLAYFARAAEIKPKDSQAPFNYADALLRLGRTDEAIVWLQESLTARDPDCPALNNLLGFAYLDVDRPDLAITPLRKASEALPRRIGWRIELIRSLFEAGQNAAAHEEIRRLQAEGYPAIRGFDDLIPFYANAWQGGEKGHAWNFFRSAIRNHPDHIILLNTAAWLLATDSAPPAGPQEAVRLARRAAELLSTPRAAVLDTLAAALAADGEFEEAQKIAQQAIVIAREEGEVSRCVEIEKRLNSYRQNQPWRIMP